MTSKEIKITLKSGLELTIDLDRVNNYEFIEAISEMEDDARNFPKAINLLLEKSEKKKLLDSLREGKGLIPTEKVAEAMEEIILACGELKN